MRPLLVIDTERLRLTALTSEALAAWIAGDVEGLLRCTDVRFAEPVEAPPLFDDDLPYFLARMRDNPAELGWWVWLASTRDERWAVGVCGLGGRPEAGIVQLGYAVYPWAEGRGYATEAASALVTWALERPSVVAVRAVVPEWHEASLAVARKLGMTEVGRATDPEAGDVVVCQVPERPSRRRSAREASLGPRRAPP